MMKLIQYTVMWNATLSASDWHNVHRIYYRTRGKGGKNGYPLNPPIKGLGIYIEMESSRVWLKSPFRKLEMIYEDKFTSRSILIDTT